jgi:hypothetical protein
VPLMGRTGGVALCTLVPFSVSWILEPDQKPTSPAHQHRRPLSAFDPATAAQPSRQEPLVMLRVFGRLPGSSAMKDLEAGVRKASGKEAAGAYVAAAVSVYGDLTRGSEPLSGFRTGTPAE